jgi:thiol-disulfide isomerase/thioredoxin
MKTKALISLLTVTLGLIAIEMCPMLTEARADAVGPASKQAAIAAAPAKTESSARVDVKALAGKLAFLDDKPALTGRPLLIEFWATWCPPCRASIAHLNELNKQYHGRGLQIVGITGEDKAVVERFRARTPMDYAVALDADQALATEFQVQAIPKAWLLDQDGRVVWSGHPMELDEQTIARVLPSGPKT